VPCQVSGWYVAGIIACIVLTPVETGLASKNLMAI
jgi:hypothetical protein